MHQKNYWIIGIIVILFIIGGFIIYKISQPTIGEGVGSYAQESMCNTDADCSYVTNFVIALDEYGVPIDASTWDENTPTQYVSRCTNLNYWEGDNKNLLGEDLTISDTEKCICKEENSEVKVCIKE